MLSNSKKEFVRNICSSYYSDELLQFLSKNSLHASTNYSFSSISVNWKNLFVNLVFSDSNGSMVNEYSLTNHFVWHKCKITI